MCTEMLYKCEEVVKTYACVIFFNLVSDQNEIEVIAKMIMERKFDSCTHQRFLHPTTNYEIMVYIS